MDERQAGADLEYVRAMMDRAGRRIDPHLFHTVHWGAIVLVWYPLMNYLFAAGRGTAAAAVGGGALLLGAALSVVLEMRLKGRSRVAGGNAHVERQVAAAIFGPIAVGVVLSALGPATGFVDGERITTVWGLLYALMAWNVGVVYTKEWRAAAAVIFAGTVASLFAPHAGGYILGPAMGLGILVPGLMAERRVRRMREEASLAA